MIDSLRLQNYRAHVDTRISLTPLHVLVGANGSGKSSVLDALHLCARLKETSFEFLLKGRHAAAVLMRGGASTARLSVTLEGAVSEVPPNGSTPWTLHIDLAQDPKGKPGDVPELGAWRPSAHWTHGRNEKTFDPTSRLQAPLPLVDQIGNLVYLRLDPRALAGPVPAADKAPPTFGRNGDGLAALLSFLMTSEPERFEAVLEASQQVIPQLHRLRTRPTTCQLHWSLRHDEPMLVESSQSTPGHELLLDIGAATGLPASAASDGTLLVIGLAVVLYGSARPRVVLLDDLEQGLHPWAQRVVVRLLREALARDPGLQIIATTHSPYLLDQLKPEEVTVLALDEQGGAHARRLVDHPNARHALEVLETGELWAAEGEKWVLGDERLEAGVREPGREAT